MTSINLTMILC